MLRIGLGELLLLLTCLLVPTGGEVDPWGASRCEPA
jgi:hypothetical protein